MIVAIFRASTKFISKFNCLRPLKSMTEVHIKNKNITSHGVILLAALMGFGTFRILFLINVNINKI